jgi:nucleoside diphosphate kinase
MAVPGEWSLVIVKPDAMERGLAPALRALVESVGLRVTREVERTLTATDIRLLDYRNQRRLTPLQFAVNCQYLTRGPVEVWLVEGPEAIGKALLAKAVARANFGDTDLGNVLHSAEDDAEAAAQAATLFPATVAAAEEVDPETGTAAGTGPAEEADPDRVEFLPLIRDAVRAASDPPPAGPPDWCGVLLHDHNCLSVDATVDRLVKGLPGLQFDDAVRYAIAAKAHGWVEVFAGTPAEAALVNLSLDAQELWVSYRGPVTGAPGPADRPATSR